MLTTPDTGGVDRRAFLRRAGLGAGAAAVLPLLGAGSARATGAGGDPDELFQAGRFAEADRGYARLLRADPDDAHAAARRGYIALLSNRFAAAERYLTRAVRLVPDDTFSLAQLADCFVRQDRLDRAVPLLRAAGQESTATQYASVTGTPYQVRGARTARLPWVTVDPLPMVEASVNGAEPATFFLDTGATLGFSADTARKAGLRAVATIQAGSPGHVTTLYLGVVESLRLGGIELRNVPVSWGDLPMPAPPGGAPAAGAIGTTVFYHFLTTMDYANRALVLRRKSAAPPARRPGASVLPLWLAGDHFPFTLGSLNGYGPRVVSMDTGGSRIGVVTTEEIAARAGIAVDHDHPVLFNGVFTCYPIAPDTISLGHAVGRKVPGLAGPHQLMLGDRVRFDTIANVTHEFFKPFAITFDFVTMTFTITSCTS